MPYALIIGNNYQGTHVELKGCHRDADLWREWWEAEARGEARVILGATKADIIRGLREVGERRPPPAQFWLFLHGHGAIDPRTRRYRYLTGDGGYIHAKEFEALLGAVAAPMRIVLDTCHSGGALRIAEFAAETVLLGACGAREVSYEIEHKEGGERRSAFSHCLREELRRVGARGATAREARAETWAAMRRLGVLNQVPYAASNRGGVDQARFAAAGGAAATAPATAATAPATAPAPALPAASLTLPLFRRRLAQAIEAANTRDTQLIEALLSHAQSSSAASYRDAPV